MKRFAFLAIFVALCAALQLEHPPSARPFDLALVLDESGSMKKNDPRQSRQGAAELFIMLCQPEHRVELMGFATEARILGEFARMGEGPTRSDLLKAVGKVSSSGQWTDIELAIKRAMDELQAFGRQDAAHAILLMTDGKVDRGRGKAADTASILRIRGDLVSELIQQGVRVYCVAFSKAADRKLLNYLSEATGGLCVQGDRDDELQRLFLRLFEEVAQPQTIPLANSQAVIDPSVHEATFLITLKGDDQPLRLQTPDGKEITRKNWERMKGVRWFATPRYDMITLSEPAPGTWRVSPATTNDDDRVIVLTDLQLDLANFDPVAKPQQTRRIHARLQSQGETVKTPELIQRLTMEARLHTGGLGRFRLGDDGRHQDGMPADGLYGGQFVSPARPGSYDLEIIARAPTLERRIVRTIHIVDRWFEVALEKEVVQPGDTVPIKVVVPAGSPVPGKDVSFRAVVTHEGNSQEVAVLPVGANLYTVSVDQTRATGDYTITVTGSVAGVANEGLRETIGPLRFRVVKAQASALAVPPPEHSGQDTHTAHPTPPEHGSHEAVSHPTPHEVAPTTHHTTPHTDTTATEHAPEPAKEKSSLVIPLLAGILFLLVLCAGLLGFLIVKKHSTDARGGAGTGSMSTLRKRAAQIREEEYETAEEVAEASREKSLGTTEPSPEAPESQDLEIAAGVSVAAAPTVIDMDEEQSAAPRPPATEAELTIEQGTSAMSAPPDDAELIPPATEEPEEELPVVTEEGSSPENTGALSNTEAGLLAEIMGESQDEEIVEPEEPAPPESEQPSSEIAEQPEEPATASEPEVPRQPEPAEEQVSLGQGLNENENDLLAEIMGEVDAAAGIETPAPQAPEPQPEPAPEPVADTTAPLSDSESDLLSEILGETGGEEAPANPLGDTGGGTPTIPEERDDKSDQDAIDDILKQIEGLVE